MEARQGNGLSMTAWVRGFLVSLIVDVIVEFYRRTKTDPEFTKKLQGAFDKLNSAQTQEDDDAAAKEIQNLISS